MYLKGSENLFWGRQWPVSHCIVSVLILRSVEKKKKAERETARGHRLEGSGGIRASAKADSCGFRLGGGLNHCTISRLRNILLLITPSILLPMLVFGPGAWSHVSLSGPEDCYYCLFCCSGRRERQRILYTLHLRRTVCQSLYKQHGIVCWQAASQLLTYNVFLR